MKKLLFTFVALLLSGWMMAGSFVQINYSTRAELEQLFADPNLTVHHFTNSEVYATAKVFDAKTMVMIDENAFQDCEVYTLLYDPNPVIFKGAAMPFKNDGAVAIFNKEARLAPLTRHFPVVTEVDPRIREMMDQVSMDSLEATVQHLQDYGSRFFNSDGAYAASDWVAGKMAALGLEVEQQDFTVSGSWVANGPAAPNVIGIQRGTLYPDTYVVCGSHFDSFTWDCLYGGGDAPGADDNATGVATVLETARILSQYQFEYSIVYCTFGAEELGLYGSEAYASRCQQEGMDIIGYFNNDMNGYLNPGDDIHIHCIYPNSVEPIGEYYINVANVYFPEMSVSHEYLSGGDSDHTSFCNHGYLGIFPFEDVNHESPYIHTTNDLIGPSVNSFAMVQRFCQMNLGCLSEIANIYVDHTAIGETANLKAMVYPNPVENQLTVKAKGLQRVMVYNVMGQQVASIEVKQEESTIEMGNYPQGLYTLQLVTEYGIVNQNVVVK